MEFSSTSFSSAHFLFHRQQSSSLPSSASAITSTLSATPQSKSTFPSVATIHRQSSLQADFSSAVSIHGNFSPTD
jgi:hypothetical protein